MSFRQGARQFFEKRGKSAPTARDYVQNGLIAMWDGIENAGWGVHDSTSRTWVDISGNGNDAVFTKGNVSPEFNPAGSWGDDCYIFPSTIATAEVGISFGAECSVESCWSDMTPVSKYCGVYDTKDDMITWWRADGNINNPVSARFLGSSTQLGIYGARQGTSSHVVDSTSMALTINGASSKVYYQHSQQTKTFCIGGPYATNFFTGKIHCTRIYSRALTAAEIAANYAIDKARFNLP